MKEKEQRDFFRLCQADQNRILRSPKSSRPQLLRALVDRDKALMNRDKALMNRDKERKMRLAAEKELKETRKHMPTNLTALKKWMKRPAMKPSVTLPDDPLYWEVDKYRTDAYFPDGYCKFLGITGGGKTRRLVETIHQTKCIFLTAAALGNGGGKALERLLTRLSRDEAAYSREQLKYWWTALLYAHCRFYKAFIKNEKSGTRRVGLWMEGAKRLDDWIAKIPEPPAQDSVDLLKKAISSLNREMTPSVLLLVDEMQTFPDAILESFLSAARYSFESAVFTGTGLSADRFQLAWNMSVAGKSNLTIRVPGPALLTWKQVTAYWDESGEPTLKEEIQKQGSNIIRWFNPCRARVAAVALKIFKKSNRRVKGILAIDQELHRLTDPNQPDFWLRKNALDGENKHVLVGDELLRCVLAKLFLGDTLGRVGNQNFPDDEDLRNRELLMSIGVAPTQEERIREFMVMECLRRSKVVQIEVPRVMRRFLKAGTLMSPQAAGFAFEKCVAVEIMRKIWEEKGQAPKVKVCLNVVDVLQGSNDPSTMLICFPDKDMGPDLVIRWGDKLLSAQCKFRKKLNSINDTKYAAKTTNLLLPYRNRDDNLWPPSATSLAAEIAKAATGKKIHRFMILRNPLTEEQHSRVQKLGVQTIVWSGVSGQLLIPGFGLGNGAGDNRV
eukprot:3938487-Rhodomonas_salina.1